MDIINFSNCEYSSRHGRYGGNAGDKDGIIYNNEYWIIKYPKTTKDMKDSKSLASYTTSPLSEYLGSHIYEILGYDVHKTELGVRHNQLVVACKDFQKNFGDLGEIRTLKNAAHAQIQLLHDEDIPMSATGDLVNYDELIFHLNNNPLLQIPGIKERFFDQIVVDIFINNNDRNNGNWGILYQEDSRVLAPIFDNGNSFYNKMSDQGIEAIMNLPEKERINRLLSERTAYVLNGKQLSAKKMLNMDDRDLRLAILRVVPKITQHMDQIYDLIDNLPNSVFSSRTHQEILVCSNLRKDFYEFGLQARLDLLLEPARQISERMIQNQDYNQDCDQDYNALDVENLEPNSFDFDVCDD